MEIYVVQSGDTIEEIANNHGVSVERLVIDNELANPDSLLVGQALVIVYPSKTYRVREGDTLSSIAALNSITINELLRNNPFIINRPYIYPGEELAISYNRNGSISTYGYTNTFINRQTLLKTLPFLTYLSIFDYQIVPGGEVIGTDNDIDIIEMAIQHGVIPLIHLTTISVQGEIDLALTYRVISNEALQDVIFENMLEVLREKGYHGIIISAQLIDATNQDLFYNYTRRFSERLASEGYITLIAIDPNAHSTNGEVTFETLDLSRFSDIVYSILFLQYTWGAINDAPSPVISMHVIDSFLTATLPSVDTDKVSIGVPIVGYIWDLPYVAGVTNGNSITIDNVISLAIQFGANIQFDEKSQTPFFIIENYSGESIVWYVNALTINSLLQLLVADDVSSIVVWNIMSYVAPLWLIINSQYEIIKLLPEF